MKDEIDFEITEFYRLYIFEKVEILMFFFENFQNFPKNQDLKQKEKKEKMRAPALRVIRAETWLTVYRSLPYARSSIRNQDGRQQKW